MKSPICFVPLLALTACQGVIADPVPGVDGTNSESNGIYACTKPTERGTSESRMRRLVRGELSNTLTDIFGDDVVGTTAIRAQLAVLPNDVPEASVDEIAESHPSAQFDVMLHVATDIADKVVGDEALLQRIVGACATTTLDDACVRAFITTFGAKIERRPLETSEVDALLAFYAKQAGSEGLKRLLMRFVLSPALSFHIEARGTEEGGRVRLSDYEIASRISYRVTGTLPDPTLLESAANGELHDLTNVENHVRRLLETTRGKERLADLFHFFFQLQNVEDPLPAAAKAHGIEGEGLAREAIDELHALHDYLTWNNGTLEDLFTTRVSFPRSQRMATILGASSIAEGSTPVNVDADHAGAILRPAFLLHPGARTNPMRRSSTVRKHVLCEAFGSPDPAAVQEAEQALDYDPFAVSNRQHFTTLTSANECQACHTRVNPVGFALEGYDQVGMKRTSESVFGDDGEVESTFAIDTRVGDPMIDTSRTITELADALELENAIAVSEGLRACFTRTVYEMRLGRSAVKADYCAMHDIVNKTDVDGSLLDVFVASVANEDIFWKALEH